MIRRANGITSANVGRSPKPAKWASSGTPARRIESRPLRPTVTTVRSPGFSVISRAANRIVLVLSGPARPRSVVIEHDHPLAAFALGEKRVVLAAEHRREIGQHLVDHVAVRPRRQRRVLGALQLRRGDELHRPRDLLDVADGADPPPDVALSRPIRVAGRPACSAQRRRCRLRALAHVARATLAHVLAVRLAVNRQAVGSSSDDAIVTAWCRPVRYRRAVSGVRVRRLGVVRVGHDVRVDGVGCGRGR